MNRLFILGLFTLGTTACLHHQNLSTDLSQRYSNCEAFENFTVPVKEGYTTYVTYGEDTLAVANEQIVIKVPKTKAAFTKSTSSALKINYEVLQQTPTYSRYWQAVMFEDTRTGDYDYNDLVLHISNDCQRPWEKDYSTLTIQIQPIALGSIKTIRLGCIVCDDKSEHIISENVRKDLFHDREGFVNTLSDKEPVRYKREPQIVSYQLPRDAIGAVAWFIEVDGNRYYAVSAELDYKKYDMFNPDGMPYGLVVNSQFSYPEEKQSIFNAYPDFLKWLNNSSNSIGNPQKTLLYKYTYRPCSPYLWDYKDLE